MNNPCDALDPERTTSRAKPEVTNCSERGRMPTQNFTEQKVQRRPQGVSALRFPCIVLVGRRR
jgi:hypothetical protein